MAALVNGWQEQSSLAFFSSSSVPTGKMSKGGAAPAGFLKQAGAP